MNIKELLYPLEKKYNINLDKSFKLSENPYNYLVNNKLPVTEYQVGDDTYYGDDNNNIYKLIDNPLCSGLAKKVGYLEKKIIFLVSKEKN